jgi:hypothetical protein
MDDRKPSFPHHDPCRQTGSDSVPMMADVRHSAEPEAKLSAPGYNSTEPLPTVREHESSQMVYCGSAQQVSEGFAIALRIMGLDANFPPVGIAPATSTPNTEDN